MIGVRVRGVRGERSERNGKEVREEDGDVQEKQEPHTKDVGNYRAYYPKSPHTKSPQIPKVGGSHTPYLERFGEHGGIWGEKQNDSKSPYVPCNLRAPQVPNHSYSSTFKLEFLI